MGAEAQTLGDDKAQEQAWKDAGLDREGMPPPTGSAVSSVDGEKDMIRGMQAHREQSLEQQRAMLRGPGVAPASENGRAAPPRDESFAPPPEIEAPAPRETRAAAIPPPATSNDEGEALERQILAGEAPDLPSDDVPDTMVKVGGKEIPLSRIRSGLDALSKRDAWNAEYTQKQQALARANDLMIDAAREFQRDPVGAAEKIGIAPDRLAQELQKRGLLAEPAAKPTEALPEDADPLAKALFLENQALKRANARYDNEIGGIKKTLTESGERSRAAELRQQQSAALSGAKSELTTMAAKMPSMQEAAGKLNPTGKAIVELVSTRLAQEVLAYGQPVDAAMLRPRAVALFGETARSLGVTPKAIQARNALSRRTDPVPTRTGTTLPPTQAATEKSKPGSYNFDNDEERRAAANAWMQANAET